MFTTKNLEDTWIFILLRSRAKNFHTQQQQSYLFYVRRASAGIRTCNPSLTLVHFSQDNYFPLNSIKFEKFEKLA